MNPRSSEETADTETQCIQSYGVLQWQSSHTPTRDAHTTHRHQSNRDCECAAHRLGRGSCGAGGAPRVRLTATPRRAAACEAAGRSATAGQLDGTWHLWPVALARPTRKEAGHTHAPAVGGMGGRRGETEPPSATTGRSTPAAVQPRSLVPRLRGAAAQPPLPLCRTPIREMRPAARRRGAHLSWRPPTVSE